MIDIEISNIITGLLCYLIIILIIITIHNFTYNCTNARDFNFSRYDSLNQNKSIENLAYYSNNNNILDLPIKDFYVNSSHNSYINGNQILESSNTKYGLINTLKNGARMVELDVYPCKFIKSEISSTNLFILIFKETMRSLTHLTSSINNDDTPVVAHVGSDQRSYTNIVDLEVYLNIIKEHAFKYTSDPLIINLEIRGSEYEGFCRKLVNSFQRILGDKLYEQTLNKTTPDKLDAWPNVPIRNILNKIIVICSFPKDWDLFNNITVNIIHGFLGNNDYYRSRNYSQTDIQNSFQIKNKDFFTRIYPANIYFSSNYNPCYYWCFNHNAVSQNFTSDGVKGIQNSYVNKFKYSNLVPIHANIENIKRIIFPLTFNNSLLYEDTIMDMEYLKPNTCYRRVSWLSNNKKYKLIIHNNGDFIIYGNKYIKSIYRGNNENGVFIKMQVDGNLVLYNKDLKLLWESNTGGYNNAFAYINNKGKLVIRYKDKNIKKFG